MSMHVWIERPISLGHVCLFSLKWVIMMAITIKETKSLSDWYGNTNRGRPVAMLSFTKMIKSTNMNVFLYYFLSITLRLSHSLPGASLYFDKDGGKFNFVCACVCLYSGSREKLLSVVYGIWSIFSRESSRVKLQRNTQLWLGPLELKPATELHWLPTQSMQLRHFLNVTFGALCRIINDITFCFFNYSHSFHFTCLSYSLQNLVKLLCIISYVL